MPLERLTMLVLARGRPVLVVPALEAPRVAAADDSSRFAWDDAEDPIDLVTALLGGTPVRRAPLRLAISDRSWATTVLALQRRFPDATGSRPRP